MEAHVTEMIKDNLQCRFARGLANANFNCGCDIDNLFPCAGGPFPTCFAARRLVANKDGVLLDPVGKMVGFAPIGWKPNDVFFADLYGPDSYKANGVVSAFPMFKQGVGTGVDSALATDVTESPKEPSALNTDDTTSIVEFSVNPIQQWWRNQCIAVKEAMMRYTICADLCEWLSNLNNKEEMITLTVSELGGIIAEAMRDNLHQTKTLLQYMRSELESRKVEGTIEVLERDNKKFVSDISLAIADALYRNLSEVITLNGNRARIIQALDEAIIQVGRASGHINARAYESDGIPGDENEQKSEEENSDDY